MAKQLWPGGGPANLLWDMLTEKGLSQAQVVTNLMGTPKFSTLQT